MQHTVEKNTTNYPSVTLTRIFLQLGLAFLEVFFGLAIAWLPLDSQLRGFLWTCNCMVPLGSQLRCLGFQVQYSWL